MAKFYRQRIRYFVSTVLLFISVATLHSAIASPLWQGPYIGGFLGGGFGTNHISSSVGSVTDTSYFATPADANAVNDAGTSTKNPSSAIIGIQAGHDWAWKQAVFGIVLDYGALPFSSTTNNTMTYPSSTDQYSISTAMNTNWLFTLRGRVGYQVMLHWPSLLYLTGGMAMTHLTVNNNFSDNSFFLGNGGSSNSENQIGWAAGGGIELLSWNRVSVFFEYLYVRIPSLTTTGVITNTSGGFGIPPQSLANPFSTTGQFHANLLKLGLNYRFDE